MLSENQVEISERNTSKTEVLERGTRSSTRQCKYIKREKRKYFTKTLQNGKINDKTTKETCQNVYGKNGRPKGKILPKCSVGQRKN